MDSLTVSVLSWDVPNLQIVRSVFLNIGNKNTTCPVNSKDKQPIEFEKNISFFPKHYLYQPNIFC